MLNRAIEIKNLTKIYENFTLGPISFNVPSGCIVGYIGENGAGKSTTIKAILGLIQSNSGKIKVLGQEIYDNPALMNKIGVVFDDCHLPEQMKIREAEKFCQLSFQNWQKDVFHHYIQHFNLPENKKIKELSRGMKMKLSLAIALSHQAELLVLDEATSGLDSVVRDEILDILLDFLQDENHTVFISSHILSDLEKVADYIAFLHKGKLLFMEQKDDLIEKYALCSVDNETAECLNSEAIVGRRKHSFGQDLLVKRRLMPDGIELTKPSIENIMVYTIRGEENESTDL